MTPLEIVIRDGYGIHPDEKPTSTAERAVIELLAIGNSLTERLAETRRELADTRAALAKAQTMIAAAKAALA